MSINFDSMTRPVWLVTEAGELLFANAAADVFLGANQLQNIAEFFDVCGGLQEITSDLDTNGIFSTEVGDGVFCVAYEIDAGVILVTVQPRAPRSSGREGSPLLMLGKLGGKLGHDFNNILGSIQGCVELVRSKVNTGASKDAFERPFKILDSALAKSVQLTDKIRGFVREEVGEAPLRESVTNAISACQKIDPTFAVEVRAQPPACRVGIAPQQFEQLLVSLLMNAHESAPGTVALDFSSNGEMMEVAIIDGGAGFSEARLAAPFAPFSSSKSAGVGKGYGLGLAMANEILTQAGGALTLKNLTPGAEVRISAKVLV